MWLRFSCYHNAHQGSPACFRLRYIDSNSHSNEKSKSTPQCGLTHHDFIITRLLPCLPLFSVAASLSSLQCSPKEGTRFFLLDSMLTSPSAMQGIMNSGLLLQQNFTDHLKDRAMYMSHVKLHKFSSCFQQHLLIKMSYFSTLVKQMNLPLFQNQISRKANLQLMTGGNL